jgi:ribosomal protein S18 acetylase RimI-like enzyme
VLPMVRRENKMESPKNYLDTFHILKELGTKASLKLLGSRILSINYYYVLRKNLLEPEPSNPIKNKMEISPICEGDINAILNSLGACSAAEKKDVLSYVLFYQSGFKNCYVMRRGDKIAYMQTLILPTDNELITDKYRSKFYPLKDTQVMIENVFTFPPYRGLGCFQSGTLQLLALARAQGYRSALCYVRKERVAALTDLVNMGFKITKIMPEYKILGGVWRAL